MSFLVIKNVEKHFEDLQVLKKVNLSIEKGKLVTLLGPSGSGKSTLLRCIAGLEEISGGSIMVNGKDITNEEPKDRDVGMVFQQYVLFPNMNVYDNIAFGMKLRKIDKKEIDQRVKEVLEIVELQEKKDAYPHQLSGGQQQRVALARSIVLHPKILLFDEPLSALDRKIRKSLQIAIKKIQRQLDITSVFVTHDQEEAMTISDEIYVMNAGKIEQSGTPREIYKNPKTSFIARFIGAYNVIDKESFQECFEYPINGKEIAIRPEVMDITKEEVIPSQNDIVLKDCLVTDVSIIGNVIRYEVKNKNLTFNVDVINKNVEEIGLEDQVSIIIPKKYCVHIAS